MTPIGIFVGAFLWSIGLFLIGYIVGWNQRSITPQSDIDAICIYCHEHFPDDGRALCPRCRDINNTK